MIHVLATIEVKPGTRAEFLNVFNQNVPNVLAEDGCHAYVPAVDTVPGFGDLTPRENVVVVIEEWESVAHLEAHLAAPHMATFREAAKDMLVGVDLQVLKS